MGLRGRRRGQAHRGPWEKHRGLYRGLSTPMVGGTYQTHLPASWKPINMVPSPKDQIAVARGQEIGHHLPVR